MSNKVSQEIAAILIETLRHHARLVHQCTMQLGSTDPIKQRTLKKMRKRSKQLLNLAESIKS